jgi:SWI/SNF-related matrix-associated actin-dependent regulator 1 of chromatin subfamily A
VILTHRNDRFICFASYDERHIPKGAGFRWDGATKSWHTLDAETAARLDQFADDHAWPKLEAYFLQRRASIEDSRAEKAVGELPCPSGLSYLPYQRAGIAYALKRSAVLIGDEPGLGKTIQAIGIVNATEFSGAPRVLVVCPATLRLNWRFEWRKWCIHPIKPVVVTDIWPTSLRGLDLFGEGVAAIMSYEGAVKWKHHIDRLQWSAMILDEAHALKNPATKRTKAIFGSHKGKKEEWIEPVKAERKIALTGTPIVNRPGELWPLIKCLDPTGLGSNKKHFDDRYVYSSGNMRELHDRMRASFMVRRLKADVLKELPAKRRQVILIEPAGAGALLATESALIARKRAELANLEHENAVEKLRMWRGAAMQEISRIRHETALAKVPSVIDHVFGVLDETDKVIVFHHHHDVGDQLAEALPGVVRLDGRCTPEEKDTAVRRFQTDPKARVFLGSIRAAGMGITLTAASTVVFMELDWSPASMIQAEDRAHRIGQPESVLVQHLVIDGSIDQRMSKILIDKADMIGQILDGEMPQALKASVLDDMLKE